MAENGKSGGEMPDRDNTSGQLEQQTPIHASSAVLVGTDESRRATGGAADHKLSSQQPPNATPQDHVGRVVAPDATTGFTASIESGTTQRGLPVAKRRIIAEDPEWNLAPVERLSNLCVKVIVIHFEKNPVLKGTPEKYRDRIIAAVSIDIPLSIAAPLIPDDSYWQRRAKTRFKLANVQEHGGSWKRLFFELHLRDRIETCLPTVDGGNNEALQNLLAEIQLGAPFVQTLHLRQLKPAEISVVDLSLMENDDVGVLKKQAKDVTVATSSSSNRIDLSILLEKLVNLKDLSVYYGVRDCGINFSWSYFGMTLNDSLRLCESLKVLPLQRLVIQASAIDDDRCRLICHTLLTNSRLVHLDLSHNKIGDSGARGLAKMLAAPQIALTELLLSNNKIALVGAQSLGKALSVNASLKHLDLRLNHLGDAGGHAIFAALTKNKSLQSINVSGNGLGNKAVSALCVLLRKNGACLVSLDVSCNKLGNHGHTSAIEAAAAAAATSAAANSNLSGSFASAAPAAAPSSAKETNLFASSHGNTDGDLTGKLIFEAISQNKYLTKFDLRMTDLSSEYLVAIQGIVNENGLA